MLEDPFPQKAPPGWKCPRGSRPVFSAMGTASLQTKLERVFLFCQNLVEVHSEGYRTKVGCFHSFAFYLNSESLYPMLPGQSRYHRQR